MTSYDEAFRAGNAHLENNETFSFQFINADLPPEEGFIDIAISRKKCHVEGPRKEVPNGYSLTTLAEMIATFDERGFDCSNVLGRDSFKELIGSESKILRNEFDDNKFLISAQDRIMAVFINKDWDSLEQLYGTYLKTTRH